MSGKPTVHNGAAQSADSRRETLFAYALLTVMPLFMASNVVIGRAAVEAVPPIGLAFWRWLVAFAILLPFAWIGLRRHWSVIWRKAPALLFLGALGMGICGAFVYIGLESTTATNAGLIYAASPILICLFGALFAGEGLVPRQILGIVLAIVGVLAILTRGAPWQLFTFEFVIGDLWIVAATISWAVYSVTIKHQHIGLPTIPLFAAIAAAGVVILAPFYAWETASGAEMTLTWRAVISVAGVALISSVFAFGSYQKGIAVVGSSRAGVFMYLMPVYTALMAVLFLGEAFETFHLVGLLLIVPGVALATLPPGMIAAMGWARARRKRP
jgi:drug/metabolite transporter (DMT)-like permease